MSCRLQKQILQCLYHYIGLTSGGHAFCSFVKHDFLWKSLSAMKVLHTEGKHNLLYHLSHCFLVEEESGLTRMPLNRMPYGLIDYNIRFFFLIIVSKTRFGGTLCPLARNNGCTFWPEMALLIQRTFLAVWMKWRFTANYPNRSPIQLKWRTPWKF